MNLNEVLKAYVDSVNHFGLEDLDELSRDQFRQAHKFGVHDVSENIIKDFGWTKLKIKVLELANHGPNPGPDEKGHFSFIIREICWVAFVLGTSVSDLTRDAFLAQTNRVTRSELESLDKWNTIREIAQAYDFVRLSPIINGPVNGAMPFDPVPFGYSVSRISTQVGKDGNTERQWISAPTSRPASDILESVPEGHEVKGVSTLVSGDGRTVQQWIKTNSIKESREEAILRLMKDLPSLISPRPEPIDMSVSAFDNDILAVYPMGDPHIGMLSWSPETGDDFDLSKAEHIMQSAMVELVTRGTRAENALIVNLGDFFHSDNNQNRTNRAGHPLDVDGRWAKVLQTGVSIIVHMINTALEHHKHVHVVNVIGNHDDHSAIFLSVSLWAYYRNEPRVTIDMSPSGAKWFRFGSNLIGMTHGHEMRHSDLESIMASERPKDWGETQHRFWLCGHIHHSVRKEERGCVIESFRTLAPRDAWAARAGYKSGRDMNRITLHREFGEIGRDIVNASYLKLKYASQSKTTNKVPS